jgi:hypothetical protein
MPSKFVVACSTLGLASLIGAAQPAFGQWRADLVAKPIIEERSYLTDSNTIYECLRRAARDAGLSSRCSVGGSAWGDLTFEMQAKELFAVVADERKFPFLREGVDGMASFCCVGRCIDGSPVDSRRLTQLPKIKVDLNTGDLSGPDGVDRKGLRIISVRMTFTLRTEGGLEVWKIDVDRNFPDKRVKLNMYTQ